MSKLLFQAEQLGEEHDFEVLLAAVFLCCPDVSKGDQLKALFPDEWEKLFKMVIARRMTNVDE